MNVERNAAFEACFDSGVSGMVNTVTLMLVDNDGGVFWSASTADIVETAAGSGVYCANRIAPNVVGQYTLEWSLDGTYDPSTMGIENLRVQAAAPSWPPLTPIAPDGGALWGPCSAWTTAEDVAACCGDLDPENPTIYQAATDEAAYLLYELSGRKWAGACEKTVVACEDSCSCGIQVLSRGYVVNSWAGYPSVSQGACGCPTSIKLSGYPLREITEVVIDGVTLASTDYKLYNRRKLARVDGGRWPSCDAICRANSEDENFITYTYGQDVPPGGSSAAAQLGCELYKACPGTAAVAGDCALPTGVTRMVRQGVTIERQAFTNWAFRDGKWQTGLSLVDAFLNGYNRTGALRRPTIWSPSRAARYAQSVGT